MFAEKQPKDGEVILTCAHNQETTTFHFFHFHDSVGFSRPDKTNGKTNWLVICQSCFLLHPNNPEAVITGDSIWKGDDPIIEEPSKN